MVLFWVVLAVIFVGGAIAAVSAGGSRLNRYRRSGALGNSGGWSAGSYDTGSGGHHGGHGGGGHDGGSSSCGGGGGDGGSSGCGGGCGGGGGD